MKVCGVINVALETGNGKQSMDDKYHQISWVEWTGKTTAEGTLLNRVSVQLENWEQRPESAAIPAPLSAVSEAPH